MKYSLGAMRSCKYFEEKSRCKNDQQREASFKNKPNKMPPLLRLDSTGEVSPARKTNANIYTCYRPRKESLYSRQDNRRSIKNFVRGFRIPSVLETGSSCIGSAASYIEGFCKSKSSRDLVRSDSDTTALQYLQKMLKNQRTMSRKYQAGSFDSVLSSHSPLNVHSNHSRYATANTLPTSEVTQAMPKSMLSSFQNKTENNAATDTSKLKYEPYVPPPLKNRMATLNKGGFEINPKLTPYNAKLLEQSRHQRKYSNQNKEVTDCNLSKRSSTRSPCPFLKPQTSVKKDTNFSLQISELENGSVMHSKSSCDSTPVDSNTSDSDIEIPKENGTIDDWFDYENNNLEFIPIHYNLMSKLQSLSVAKAAHEVLNQADCSNEKLKPALNSWFSQELDVDVQKAIEDNIQSSQEAKVFPSQCDMPDLKTSSEKLEKMCSENISDINSVKTNGNYIQSSETKFIIPQILYIRNLQNKKCRPSSKKRKRNKTRHSESDVKRLENTGKKTVQHPSNSMAFISGVDNKTEQISSHPFLMSCDTDSSSDWSDTTDSDVEIDGADDESFFCAFNEPLNLFNLKVMCSVQPETSSQPTEIDAINLSWKVNVAIGGKEKCENQKDKSSSKKVHFEDDKNLATVHPMVTWSYAYAAARKGPWEEMARDRGRFHRRITEGEKLLKSVLNSDHRDKIFKERFIYI